MTAADEAEAASGVSWGPLRRAMAAEEEGVEGTEQTAGEEKAANQGGGDRTTAAQNQAWGGAELPGWGRHLP